MQYEVYVAFSIHGTLGHYDAPNGWGTAMGAVLFLAQIMAACMNYPDEKIYVSA